MSNNVKEIVQDYLSGQWRSSCGCTARTVITRTSASNEDFAFACIKLALFHYSFIKSDESILNYAAVDLEHNVHLRSQVQQMVRMFVNGSSFTGIHLLLDDPDRQSPSMPVSDNSVC
jgi:hypothetical protein